METGQSKYRNAQDADKGHQAQADDSRHLSQFVFVQNEIIGGKAENGGHVDRQREQEQKEVAIVAPSDAIVDPRTVLIERLSLINR